MKTLIAVLFTWAFISNGAWAGENRISEAVQSIVVSQLTAFKNNDASAAWGYAHPIIQNQFRNPERFMAMVEGAYSPLMAFTQLEFLRLVSVNGKWLQQVKLQDETGQWFGLVYSFVETQPSVFRIAGVSIEPLTGI